MPAWQVAVRNAVVSLSSPGQYRVEADPARGVLVATVFEGSAVVDAAGTRSVLGPGQQAGFDLESLQPVARTAPVRTPFDDWAALRDREQDRLQSWRYVSPEMTGAESLDAAGTWANDAGLRRDLVPQRGAQRLGAVQLRSMGVDGAMGLDLGRRRALGLRAVPLRPLGPRRQPLGLGAGPVRAPAGSMRRRWWASTATAVA